MAIDSSEFSKEEMMEVTKFHKKLDRILKKELITPTPSGAKFSLKWYETLYDMHFDAPSELGYPLKPEWKLCESFRKNMRSLGKSIGKNLVDKRTRLEDSDSWRSEHTNTSYENTILALSKTGKTEGKVSLKYRTRDATVMRFSLEADFSGNQSKAISTMKKIVRPCLDEVIKYCRSAELDPNNYDSLK